MTSQAAKTKGWVIGIAWSIAILIRALLAWADRHSVGNDGIHYLDMGDAYWRGDWPMAINAVWSPFYSWLLGLALLVLQPSSYWEYAVVHLVNLLIYVGTLGCFEFFLRALLEYRQEVSHPDNGADGDLGLPEWALRILGYSWFLWSSVVLMGVPSVTTPDMCVAAVVYLAVGLLLRIRIGDRPQLNFLALGAVLGVGYLVKQVLFPLAIVFLAASVFAARGGGRAVRLTLVAFTVFLVIAGPFIVALSLAKGRLTFGDAGKITYITTLVNMPYRHWHGAPAGTGIPQHPPRQLLAVPPIYEYGSPVGGTYPPTYDSSYWYEGAVVKIDLKRQARVFLKNLSEYLKIFFESRVEIPVGLFILFYMSGRGWSIVRDLAQYWYLLIPALAALLMYALVYVEGRYIAPFIVLLNVGLYAGVRLPDSPEGRRLMTCVTIVIVAMTLFSLRPVIVAAASTTVNSVMSGEGATPNPKWEVADALRRMGVREGAKFASLEYPGRGKTPWARLARVQFVAELYDEEGCDLQCPNGQIYKHAFWYADDALKSRIIQTFRDSGAEFIVTDGVPRWAMADGWQRVGRTGTFLYSLRR